MEWKSGGRQGHALAAGEYRCGFLDSQCLESILQLQRWGVVALVVGYGGNITLVL